MKIIPFASPIHDSVAVKKILEQVKLMINRNTGGKIVLEELTIKPIDDKYRLEYTIPFIVTGGSEWIVAESYKDLSPPVILYHNGMNSLPAALEIASYFRKKGNNLGLIEINDFFVEYNTWFRLVKTSWDLRLRRIRLGLIGDISKWLIYSRTSYEELLNKGYVLEKISLDELIEKYMDLLKTMGNNKKLTDQEKALVAYRALKELIEKYKLDMITVNCFGFLMKTGTTLCYPYGILNSEGLIAGCEGDMPSTIGLYIGYRVFDVPGFMANVNRVDLQNGYVTLSHCTAPLKILKNYSLTTHYETNKSVAIRGVFETNKSCILLRISNDLKVARIIEGIIIDNPIDKELCRTRIKVKITKEGAEKIVLDPIGNHHIMFLTEHEKTYFLKEFLRINGFVTEVYYLG